MVECVLSRKAILQHVLSLWIILNYLPYLFDFSSINHTFLSGQSCLNICVMKTFSAYPSNYQGKNFQTDACTRTSGLDLEYNHFEVCRAAVYKYVKEFAYIKDYCILQDPWSICITNEVLQADLHILLINVVLQFIQIFAPYRKKKQVYTQQMS